MPSIRNYQRKRRILAGTRVLARAITSQPSVPAPPVAASRKRYYHIGDESALEIARRIVADMGNDSSDDEAAIPQGK